MVADILIISFMAVWFMFSVWYLVKDQKEAKKAGIPAGCCGCLNYKKGQCPGHKRGNKTACSE